ncbi:MAG: tripartite tricarboxylate transporter substrate binding protein [Betaproteobacteria bacterium]|nr:tripartite tricarboxylate transporter substrate binding protein [Betaproteobacteria bacterium]
MNSRCKGNTSSRPRILANRARRTFRSAIRVVPWRRRWGCALACAALWAWDAGIAAAPAYPDKTVTLVAAFPAGGSVDLVARTLAQQLSETWKQPVVVANRPGAGGNIGAEVVVRAAADGHTLLMGTTAIASSPALYARLAYDVMRDLAPVSLVVRMPNVLVVHPSLPARTVKELVALARAQPGTLNSASAGAGSSNHLALVLFNTTARVDIVHIPYKGAAPAVIDVIGGHVTMTFVPVAAAVGPVRARKLRPLGVTAATRSPALPEVPTIAEAGVPGYEATSWNALFAPAATPRDIVLKIRGAVAESLAATKVRETLLGVGAEPVGNTPEEFSGFLRAEMVKWAKVVRAGGLRPQ